MTDDEVRRLRLLEAGLPAATRARDVTDIAEAAPSPKLADSPAG